MKVLAMYLPQFYETEYNNAWWGKGFTDWKACKEAVPLFEGHEQPHIPQNDNYYDLSDVENMRWQAELMAKYGIDGMCMYHYWFGNGKMALEKPAENLLKDKTIQMPFCFYWANDSWVRSWSKIQVANPWMIEQEVKLEDTYSKDPETGLLFEQIYGEQEEWDAHFHYLLPFFRDERYLKKDGKPIFLIYKSSASVTIKTMLERWQALAVENGLPGLYIIGAYYRGNQEPTFLDSVMFHEPAESNSVFRELDNQNGVSKISYKKIWESILKRKSQFENTCFSGFVSYDDTPRRGKGGIAIVGANPDLFEYYFTRLLAKNAAAGQELVFLNAWNEWGEGMHLEPDETYGDAYLDKIVKAKAHYTEYIKDFQNMSTDDTWYYNLKNQCDRFEQYTNLLDLWMDNREKGKYITTILKQKGYRKIAIYGNGIMGRHLRWEIEQASSDFEIVCLVDQKKDRFIENIPIYYPGDLLPEYDVMIITAFTFMEEILAEGKLLGREANLLIPLNELVVETSKI